MIMLCPRKIKLISPVASTDAQRDTSFYFYRPHTLSDKMTIVSDKTKDVASAVSSKAMDLAKKRNNASL